MKGIWAQCSQTLPLSSHPHQITPTLLKVLYQHTPSTEDLERPSRFDHPRPVTARMHDLTDLTPQISITTFWTQVHATWYTHHYMLQLEGGHV